MSEVVMEERMYPTAAGQQSMNPAQRREWQKWHAKLMKDFPHHIDLEIPHFNDEFDQATENFLALKGKVDLDIDKDARFVRYLFKDRADLAAFRKQFGIYELTQGKV